MSIGKRMDDKEMIECLKKEVAYWKSESARYEYLFRLNNLRSVLTHELNVPTHCVDARLRELAGDKLAPSSVFSKAVRGAKGRQRGKGVSASHSQ